MKTFLFALLCLVIGVSFASATPITCSAPTPTLACTVDGTNCNTANPDLNCLGDGGFLNLPVGDIYPFSPDPSLGFGGYCQGSYVVDTTGYCTYPYCGIGTQANSDWWFYYFLSGDPMLATYMTSCYGQ